MGDQLLSERQLPNQQPPSTTLEVEPPNVPELPKNPKTPKPKLERKSQKPKPLPEPKLEPPRAPKPKNPRETIPPPEPEKYGIWDYMKEDFVKTTMDESLPLASKWLRRAAKVMKFIPPLEPVSTIYEGMADGLDGATLVYDLVHELSQDEAFEKGSKEAIKRTKPVKRAALKVIRKRFPGIPEPEAKKLAEKLEELFEKHVSDPGIKKLKEKMKEQDEEKDLDKSLWKKWISPTPTIP
jgi:hypothetical protein